jgi:starch-binding outer membrane protein, SusD/RagB family
MNMKKFIYFIATALVMLVASCDDFLNYKMKGEPSTENFWNTESDANRAADGLYFWSTTEGIVGRGFMWYNNASDDMVTGRSKGYADNIKNFIADNGSDASKNWPIMYQLIKRCNDIIRFVPAMEISQEVKNKTLGQAYFFRAWAYLWLAPHYGDNGVNGGIPIITEATAVEEMDMPRPAKVSDNYVFCIADFEKAAELLPYFADWGAKQAGRPHKTAAWAYAAKAALYNAQYDNTYYDKCVTYCDKVISSGKHKLLDNYADVFKVVNNFSSEYVWSWTSTAAGGVELPGVMLDNKAWGYYNGWGYFMPTLELYKEFEAGDTRRKTTMLVPGDQITFLGNTWTYGVDKANSSFSGMMFNKYMDPFVAADAIPKTVNPNGDYPTTSLSIPLIRYAEVLLWKAEALIWQDKNGDEPLNLVRKRAGLATISKATKADLKHERRCELGGEIPSRHFDLVRWGDAKATYAQPLHGYKRVTDANGAYLRSDEVQIWNSRTFNPAINHVWPIPYNEISTSRNLKQNNGY